MDASALGGAPRGRCRQQTASPEPDSAAPTDSNDLFMRVCNCDLRAYPQRTGRGYSQGFVLMRDCAPPSPVWHIETVSPSVFALLQRILLPVFWHCDPPFQLVFDALAQRVAGHRLAMHDERLTWRALESLQPTHHFFGIGVG